MEFYDVVKGRKSVRRYSSEKVPEEALSRILEAARLAPSWANKQCWRYVIVDDAEKLSRIVTGLGKAYGAPMFIVLCADPDQSGHAGGQNYYLLDAGISMEHLVLAATAEGLGTCWLGAMFDEATVKKELGIPDNLRVVAMTPLGYASEGVGGFIGNTVMRAVSTGSSRKALGEIAFRNKYGEPLAAAGKPPQ